MCGPVPAKTRADLSDPSSRYIALRLWQGDIHYVVAPNSASFLAATDITDATRRRQRLGPLLNYQGCGPFESENMGLQVFATPPCSANLRQLVPLGQAPDTRHTTDCIARLQRKDAYAGHAVSPQLVFQ